VGTLSAAQYTQSFTYDVMGRLATGPLGSYTYGSSAHVHAATAIGTSWTSAYDAAGNMTCRAPSGASTCAGTQTGAQLRFNNEGELASWQNAPSGPSTTAQLLYDGQGQRVAQVVTQGGTTTATVYVGSVEEVATSGSTTTTTVYYYAGGTRIGLSVNGTKSYLGADGLGSANVTLSSSGTATASQLFAPYGGLRYSSGTMPTSYGYTGQRADAASGLDYYASRYYDPLAGQFTSGDSLLPGSGFDVLGLSRYAYVESNPIARTDPSGHLNVTIGSNGGTCNINDPSCGGGSTGGPGGSGSAGSGRCWMTGGTCAGGGGAGPATPTPPDAKALYDDNLRKLKAIRTSTFLYSLYHMGELPTGLDDTTQQMLTILMMGGGSDACKIAKCKQAMQTALQIVDDLRSQVAAGWTIIQLGLVPAAGGGGAFTPSGRWLAVQEAWAVERDLVAAEGVGSRDWTVAEKAELVRTGRVAGYVGHHINSVSTSPELEGDPNNIKFVDDHLAEHGGNWRNPTTGALVDRTFGEAP
jgi:RHS repeat-associated protein